MVFTGGLKFTNQTGLLNWYPDSAFDTGDSLIAYFQGPIPFGLGRGTLDFNYVIDCNGCSGGNGGVSLDIYYIPNINCSCELKIACNTSVPISINCPGPCEGFVINQYSFERFNFDPPDYNEDGIPDALTPAHKDSVKKEKIIYGDTVISYVTGKVSSASNWIYLFGRSHLTNNNYLSFLTADLIITDTFGNNYTYPNFPVAINTLTGNNQEILFDFSVDSISPYTSLPSTFQYKHGDSLTLVIKYFAENNVSGNIQQISNNLRIYLSDTITPVSEANKFDCFTPLGNIQNINHYTTISSGGAYKVNSCDQRLLRKYYYFSVGPCCNNYGGGNQFRKEYRNFSRLKIMGLRLPNGYNIIQSTIREYRTRGTGGGAWSLPKNITPISTNNDSIIFRLDTSLYDDFGGPALLSDDGFHGYLDVIVEPTCAVLPDTTIRVPYWTMHAQNFNGIVDSSFRQTNASSSLTYNYPRLKVQSTNPSLVAPNRSVTWDVLIDNLSNVSYAPNLWFRKGNISGVNILSIYDVKNGVFLPTNANGFFLGDTVYEQENRVFKITADFTNCTSDSLRVAIGWNCGSHPGSVTDIDCDPLSIKLEVTPLLGALETKLIGQPDTINLCDTVTYVIEAESIQRGTVYALKFFASLPPGITILPGSSYLSLFDTTGFNLINDPTNTFGSTWRWDLDSNEQYLDTNGLNGVLDTTINKAYLKFRVLTDCNFTSGNIFTVGYRGNSPCGRPTNLSTIGTKPLYIRDATPSYNTTIKINTTYLTPCLENTKVDITIINNGPDSTYSQDSILIQLPANIDYVNGSFVGIYNPPGTTNVQSSNGTFNYIKWPLTNGISVGDSSLFSFTINADPNKVNCDVFQIRASSESFGGSFCNTSSSFCSINIVVSDTTKNIFTYKGYLSILNDSSYATFNPPSGEVGYINFDIFNTGEKISYGINTIVNYYFDADNNGILSASDIWFANDSIIDSIPNLGVVRFKDTIDIPAGNSCRIIAVIDTSDNPCTCIPSQTPINLTIDNTINDTITCANNSFIIGMNPVTGYNYTWNPVTYLNNPNISNPTFTYPPGNANDTLTYVLETDRIHCYHYDTMQIIVHGEPVSIAGIDQDLCNIYSTTLAGNQPQPNWNSYWTLLSGPNSPTFTNDSLYNTQISGLIEGSYQLEWTVTNGMCDPAKDTMMINVYDSVSANAGLDQNLCDTTSISLSGNQPTGTSSGLWTQLSGPNNATIVVDTVYNSSVTNLIEGTYSFVWTVSNGICPPDADTVIVNIYDQPTSSIGPDQDLCNQYNTSINSNVPQGLATGLWQVLSSPSAPTLSSTTQPNITLSNLIEGSYLLSWTVSNGNCPPAIDSITINVFDPISANAGPNQDLCNQYFVIMNGNQPNGTAFGEWEIISGPNNPTIVDSSQYNTAIVNLIEGTYVFKWTVKNGNCPPEVDSMVVNVYDQPSANAGNDQDLCNTYNTLVIGNTPQGTASGIWTQDLSFNIHTASIVSPTSEVTGINSFQEGSYKFIWTVSNGICPPASDTIQINVYDQPISNAGVDQSLCNVYTTQLNGNTPIGTAAGRWVVITGPNSPIFNDSTLPNATISSLVEGTYQLVWVVSNGNCPPAIDTVLIHIYDQPISSAGPNQDLCATYTTSFNGNLPTGTATGQWQLLSGPNSPTITNNTLYNSPVTGLIEGTYRFVWTVSNGICPPVADTVIINVYDMPIAKAGLDQSLCGMSFTILDGNIPLGSSNGSWSLLNAPNIPTINNPTNPSTSLTGLIQGRYELIWTVKNGTCPPAMDTVIIDNHPIPNIDFTANTVSICENECIDFTNLSTINAPDAITSYQWVFDNGDVSTDQNPTICFNTAGVYGVKLIGTSNNNCVDSVYKQGYVTVHALPIANFNFDPQFDVHTFTMIQVSDGSLNSVNYFYDFGNGVTSTAQDPTIFYEDSGIYIITQIVENIEGCKDTFAREVLIREEMIIYVPNTFTPDGDGKNDIFYPATRGFEENEYTFYVFNRWGQLVFQTDILNKGWDGIFKGEMSKTDTYVWKVVGKAKYSGKQKTLTGHVNLLR